MNVDPPIQNIDRIDIIGKRNDGALDLVIVVSGPLEDSQLHRDLVESKITSYLQEIASPEFQEQFGAVHSTSPSILVVTDFYVDPAILQLVASFQSRANQVGASV